MTKTISEAEARGKFDKILDEVREEGGEYIIEREGEPVAMLVPMNEFAQWLRVREAYFARIDELRERNKEFDPEEIEKDVEAARRAVREQQ